MAASGGRQPARLSTLAARESALVLPELPVLGSRPPLLGLPTDLLKPILIAVMKEGCSRAGAKSFLRGRTNREWVRALEGLLGSLSHSDPSFCLTLDLSPLPRQKALNLGLLPGLRNLRNVSLPAGVGPVCDGTLAALAALPELRELAARGCTGVTDAGVIALARGAAPLTALDLSGCPLVGDRGAAAVIGLARMQRLDLTETAATPAGAVANARRRRTPLELRLHGASGCYGGGEGGGVGGVEGVGAARDGLSGARPWGERLVISLVGQRLGSGAAHAAASSSSFVYTRRPPSPGPGAFLAEKVEEGRPNKRARGTEVEETEAPPVGEDAAVVVDTRMGGLMRLIGGG